MPVEQPQALSPLALSILGLEQAGFLPPSQQPPIPSPSGTTNAMQRVQARSDRRMTSYFNPFQSRCAPSNDSPPSYTTSQSQTRLASSPRHLNNGSEILPRYTCSVRCEGPMQMLLESCSPFALLSYQEWREVYIVVQGTQLNVHKLKSSSFGEKKIYSAGRLLRKYTLQQAEVGIASDITHSVLVPLTRMASIIPSIARKRAFEKDPSLFAIEKQYSLRMRAELDQFVLACPDEDVSFRWINTICAGIDIAAPIDERSLPRQCTMPRRRRRQQRLVMTTDLTDQRFIEEQERILRSMYPAFADGRATAILRTPQREERPVTSDLREGVSNPVEQEAEDVDLSALAEEAEAELEPAPQTTQTQRPSNLRPTSSESVITLSAFENFSTDPINLDLNGKWNPPHPRTATQQLRYVRRCMPVLLEATPRHTNVMINAGQYVRPNWKVDVLEEWSLKPPAYDAHDFSERSTSSLVRRATQTSVGSGQSRSASGSSDEIQRVDTPSMELTAVVPKLELETPHAPKHPDVSITVARSPSPACESKKALQSQQVHANLLMMGF